MPRQIPEISAERKTELAQEVTASLIKILSGDKLTTKTKIRASSRDDDFIDQIYRSLNKIRSSVETSQAEAIKIARLSLSYLIQLAEFKEQIGNAKRQAIYHAAPGYNVNTHEAYVFEDRTALLNNGQIVEILGDKAPVCTNYNNDGAYFETKLQAMEWKVRSLGHIVNQHPKNKDFKSVLAIAEDQYKRLLAHETALKGVKKNAKTLSDLTQAVQHAENVLRATGDAYIPIRVDDAAEQAVYIGRTTGRTSLWRRETAVTDGIQVIPLEVYDNAPDF